MDDCSDISCCCHHGCLPLCLPRAPPPRLAQRPAVLSRHARAVQGQNKTYYHVKDIAYLLHEPLLKKARELHAYEKKVGSRAQLSNGAAVAAVVCRSGRLCGWHAC